MAYFSLVRTVPLHCPYSDRLIINQKHEANRVFETGAEVGGCRYNLIHPKHEVSCVPKTSAEVSIEGTGYLIIN